MAKEKVLRIEKDKKDMTFYYEVIGILSIVIPIIAFARFGLVGYYVMLVFKIIFGDWSFLFLLFLMLYGIRCLIFHKSIMIKSVRFIGIILFAISILTLSHLPMHNYVSQFDSNYFKVTLSLYLDYLKHYEESLIVGGGIIGTVFFYLGYSLLGVAGTILIVLVSFVIGISFIFEMTLKDMIMAVINRFRKLFSRTSGVVNFLKYEIKIKSKDEKPKKTKKRASKPLSIINLEEPSENTYSLSEEQHAEAVKKTIMAILNMMNIFYESVTYEIRSHVSVYTINTLSTISLETMQMKLHSMINDKFLIRKDSTSSKVIIEVNNLYPRHVAFKNVISRLLKRSNESKQLAVGINTYDELIVTKYESPSLIYSYSDNDGVINLINSLILTPYFLYNSSDFSVYLFDFNGLYNIFSQITNYHTNFDNLEEIIKMIDYRYSKFQEVGTNNLIDYNIYVNNQNLKDVERFEVVYVYLLGIEKILSKEMIEKLSYLLQNSHQCGIYVIGHLTNDDNIPNHITSLFEYRIFLNGLNMQIIKNLGFDNTPKLHYDEAFVQYKDAIERVSLVNISKKDIEWCIKQIKK